MLTRTLQVWARNALAFSAVSVLVWLPVVALLLRYGERSSPVPIDLLVLLALALRLVSTGAISYGVLEHLEGRRAALDRMLGFTATRLWPVFAAGAMYASSVIAGCLLILPGLLALLAGYVTLPAAVAQPAQPAMEALRRSWILTHGHRPALLWAVVVLWVAAVLLGWAAFTYIAAAEWIPPVIGDVTFAVVVGLLDGLLRCCGPVAYHQLAAVQRPEAEASLS